MKAVCFGAGNIGRGFLAQRLTASGYEVVFADIDEALVDALDAADAYRVVEAGDGGAVHLVRDFRSVGVRREEERLVDEISTADLVVTAVGVSSLPFVAPVLARGIERRIETGGDAIDGRLGVMACENAIGATGLLEAEVRIGLDEADADRLDAVAAFADTAIDRIVPAQPPGLDVVPERYAEWVADRTPFAGEEPAIEGVRWVDDLAPYIERKLYTLNTGHAAAAYHGFVGGITTIVEAMADPSVRAEVEAAIGETRALLVARFSLDEAEQAAYGARVVERLADPALVDTVERVGRAPLRKLGRRDRFIGPAAALAEAGLPRAALLRAVGAALAFDVPSDPESAALQRILRAEEPASAVRLVTGVTPDHPLFPDLLPLFHR